MASWTASFCIFEKDAERSGQKNYSVLFFWEISFSFAPQTKCNGNQTVYIKKEKHTKKKSFLQLETKDWDMDGSDSIAVSWIYNLLGAPTHGNESTRHLFAA